VPDFIIPSAADPTKHLILETKGYDLLKDVKRGAAERWVAAVNADGSFGRWRYVLVEKVERIASALESL